MKSKVALLSVMAFLLTGTVLAQSTEMTSSSSSSRYGLPNGKDFDRWSVGIHGGINYFMGDIQKNSQNNNSIKDDLPKDPMYGAQVSYQFTHTTALRLGGTLGKFSGESAEKIGNQAPRTYTFESDMYEIVMDFVFTSGNISFLKRNKKFHMLGSMGVGVFNVNGSLTDSATNFVVASGNVSEGMLTLGLGFKYRLAQRLDAGLSFDFRKTFTDNVDYINNKTTETDNYLIANINLNYTFGKKQQQLEWVNPMEIVYNDMAELKDKMDVLSGDKDKDGVSDMFDKDNSTAEGTKVYGDGTAVDSDNDGIPDAKDSDPFSEKGAKVDANGVEMDTDGDGVPDSRDLEPNTEKGAIVNFQGMDLKEIIKSSSAGGVGWIPPVFFSTDQASISSAQRDRLLIVARILKANPDVKLRVIGNTDSDAGEAYNQKLGQRRADAVKDHLVKVYGIDGSRLTTESRGETEQFAKTIKSMNRRVDFVIRND